MTRVECQKSGVSPEWSVTRVECHKSGVSRGRTPTFFLLDSRTSKPKSLLVRTHFY